MNRKRLPVDISCSTSASQSSSSLGRGWLRTLFIVAFVTIGTWETMWRPLASKMVAGLTSPVDVTKMSLLCSSAKDKLAPENPVRNRILDVFFGGADPFCDFTNILGIRPDWSYPYTSITMELAYYVIDTVSKSKSFAGFFVEVGSFKGGSADQISEAISTSGIADKTALLCIDPFTGDKQQWANWNGLRKWLLFRQGAPRIFDQFMVNMIDHERYRTVVPMAATSAVGLRAIKLLQQSHKLPFVDALYLDASHEADETLIELRMAWEIVREGGIVFGDDWQRKEVREDLVKFATMIVSDRAVSTWSQMLLERTKPVENVIVLRVQQDSGQWFLLKQAA